MKPSNGVPDRIFGRVKRYEDEDKLLGAKSYGVGLGSWKVQEPDHWIFEGTGLKKGDSIPDLVGWEYHGLPVANLPGLKILATGDMQFRDYKPEETYAAVIYDGPKGNFVFDASTCWWSMPLSKPPLYAEKLNPDGAYDTHPISFAKGDERVRRMTENLFNRVTGKK
jgi:hypothetical protein